MKRKIYQVNPMYQSNLLWNNLTVLDIDDMYPHVSIVGNDHYNEHLCLEYKEMSRYMDNAVEEFRQGIENGFEGGFATTESYAADVAGYWFGDSIRKNYNNPVSAFTDGKAQRWVEILTNWEDSEKQRLEVLELLTGLEFECATIRGFLQCEWNCVYYPVSVYGKDFIRKFENMYFNMGAEWLIESEYGSPDWRAYTLSTDVEEARKELAEMLECDVEDLELIPWED